MDKSLFGYHENRVISLSFHDPSSKPSGTHRWQTVWLSFGWLLPWLKNSKFWMWMMENENRILVFSKVENWNSVANVVNKMTLWALYQCVVTSESSWVITVATPLFHFISPPNFQQNFSLSSLPSLSLISHQSQTSSHFHFPLHPQWVSSMMNTLWLKHWTRPEKNTAWLKHWTRPESLLASP